MGGVDASYLSIIASIVNSMVWTLSILGTPTELNVMDGKALLSKRSTSQNLKNKVISYENKPLEPYEDGWLLWKYPQDHLVHIWLLSVTMKYLFSTYSVASAS